MAAVMRWDRARDQIVIMTWPVAPAPVQPDRGGEARISTRGDRKWSVENSSNYQTCKVIGREFYILQHLVEMEVLCSQEKTQ